MILEGRSAVISSDTGSGKTFCYLIPIMHQLLAEKQQELEAKNLPRGAIILTPTKELCAQVYRTIRLIDKAQKLRVTRTGSLAHIAPIV